MKVLNTHISHPVVNASEVKLKILGFDEVNQLAVELLPAHVLHEKFEAAKLDGNLTVLVEIFGFGVVLVEDEHLGETIYCFDSVTKIILRIAHFQYRLKDIRSCWHIEI